MRFSFIHAADLHIDSPLDSLARKSPEAAAQFAEAGRKAVTALIEETLQSGAKFLIVAGDIFDGDWADYTTGLFFAGELARLERAGVPVFIIRGNHDAASNMSKRLKWPGNVRLFSSRTAESRDLPDVQTVLHGRSFAERNVPDDFVATYPPRREGWLNIGVLHTSLAGRPGHDPYAPCSADDLARFGYDYWALGHIHKQEIVARDPWIVFPGNIQGRHVREAGAKGAMRVTVEDGRIVDVEPVALDKARWAREEVDISGCATEEDVFDAIHACITDAYAGADGRPLAVRLLLCGETQLHNALAADIARIEAQAQITARGISDDIWIESLRLQTGSPRRTRTIDEEADALVVEDLLRESVEAAAFSETLAALAGGIRNKLPRELQESFDAMTKGDAEDALSIAGEAQALLLGRLQQDGES